MAKELPYFQFEPAEYLTKDISFCSLSAQGLFINICSYYWQRQCDLTKDQFLRRFNYLNEFNELIDEGIIDLVNNKIVIKFLDNQYFKATEFSKEQSRKGSLGGRPKKPKETQTKAELKLNESQIKAIREDKIKVNNILLSEIKISDVDEDLKQFYDIALNFQQLFIKNLKEKNAPTKQQENATFKKYVDPIRLMIKNNECTIENLREVYAYLNSPRGEFWKTNILSTETLRKQITKLVMSSKLPEFKPKKEDKL
jgi:hypothetical protein